MSRQYHRVFHRRPDGTTRRLWCSKELRTAQTMAAMFYGVGCKSGGWMEIHCADGSVVSRELPVCDEPEEVQQERIARLKALPPDELAARKKVAAQRIALREGEE